MDDKDVYALLSKWGGLNEVAEVREFRGYKGGREAIVRIYDRGPDAGSIRYSVETEWAEPLDYVVTEPKTHFSHGNPDESLDIAVMNVHWGVLSSDAE